MHKTFDPANLKQFTGTERYYRISRRHLLTDGTMYLAEHAKCYWLMIAVASHLTGKINDYFAVAKLSVVGNGALLTLDDGRVVTIARETPGAPRRRHGHATTGAGRNHRIRRGLHRQS